MMYLTHHRRVHTLSALFAGLSLIGLLSACGPERQKSQQQLIEEVELAELVLVINRRLYIEANARDSYFQGGYAQQLRNIDKYEPFCRFSINYELAGDAQTTVVDAQRIGVISVNRARQAARLRWDDLQQPVRPVQVAGGTEQIIAGETQLDVWLTRLNLQSPTQPWLSGLDCEVFGSRSRHLSIDDIREVLHPSMALEQGNP